VYLFCENVDDYKPVHIQLYCTVLGKNW